jgi:tetratricopeptide (TPR) repeat protein
MERQEWHLGFDGADAPFSWGSTRWLLDRGKFAESLEGPRLAALSRAERWANDNYEQARQEFRLGHFQESLNRVLAGLHGSQGRTGNPKDYRLLFLLGLIRMGNFDNPGPELLDLAGARSAFSTAASTSVAIQPGDAAWAFAAAAWASYCAGEWDAGLGYARQALLLRSRFGEMEYLTAKIHLRMRRPDPAMGALANAVAIHPAFALRATRDADFAKAGSMIETVAKTERLRLKQRAQDRVKTAVERAIQHGVLEPGKKTASELSAGLGASCPTAMLEATTDLIGRDTLFGFFEAEVLATQLIDSLASLALRCEADKQMVNLAIHQAHKTMAELSDQKWRSSRASHEGAKELAKAVELLKETADAVNVPGLGAFLINREPAKQALAGAVDILERCKCSALDEASAKRNELDVQISRSAAIEESWARCIRRGAIFGLLVAAVITLYTEILSGGGGIGRGNLPALTRLALLTLASTFVGALGGAVTAPIVNSGAQAHLQKAESAKNEVEEAIRRLMAVPLHKP